MVEKTSRTAPFPLSATRDSPPGRNRNSGAYDADRSPWQEFYRDQDALRRTLLPRHYGPLLPSLAKQRDDYEVLSVDERNPPAGENPVGKLSKRIGRFRERGSQNSSLQTPASRPVLLCDTRSSPPCWQHMIFEELREQAQGLLTDLGVRPPLLGKG